MEPEQVSDAELIVRVRSGDASAMGELYVRHSEAALRVARATSRDPHLAEDLVASAFERIHGAIARGAGPADSFRAYLYTVVRRLAAEAGVLKARERDTDDWSPYESATAVPDDADRGLEAQLVATAFRTLPERQQAVLWYLEVEGMTPLQAAPLFGLSPNATSALAVRARDALRVAYVQAHVSDSPIHAECAPTRKRLGGYLRSTLSQRDAAKVEAHLLACDECPLVLEELKDVGYGLKSVFGPILVGGGVLGAVLAAAGGPADSAMAAAAGAGIAGTGSGGGNPAGQSKQATRFATAAIGVLAALGIAAVVSAAVSAPPAASEAPPATSDEQPAPVGTPAPAPTTATPTPSPSPTPSASAQAPAPAEPATPPAPAPSVADPPPVAALDLDFSEDVQRSDGSWSGSVIVAVTNPNSTPVQAVLRVQLPDGVQLDASAPLGGGAWSCQAGDPLVCTAASIPVGGRVGLVVPVVIDADALGSRPVASVTVTRP
ncbi:MAG: hypothetical protein BGO95_02150 [Micrococcales bacterium 73-13]|nr:MAG: hypothetical protein BGO95_02150 [Micrococcales bacterium 73-13]